MKLGRYLYYVFSLTLSALAISYCILVFFSGQYDNVPLGSYVLIGKPNYYFFYIIVLPVIATGIVYLALENKYVRLFGELSNDLDDKHKRKIRILRIVFLCIAVLASVMIVIQDAANKDYPLPPNDFNLSSKQVKNQVAVFYQKQRNDSEDKKSASTTDHAKAYLEFLKEHGFRGKRINGFDSISTWYSQSSGTYKFESLLSFLAALITSLLFVEILLLLVVKNYVKPATKNLLIWLVILISLWFPMKMYSAWYFSFNRSTFSPPAIFWFGLVILVIGALLVFFIRTERNNLNKYASIVAAVASALVSVVSYFKPKFMENVIQIIGNIGWVYEGVLATILIISLFLVTDYFITDYEEEVAQ